MVLAFFCLIAAIAFVAFSIDTGNIALNKTLMQNGVDAAALAAAMEITHAVENAPIGEEDPTAFAREAAKLKAVEVAALNNVFVDANTDVTFGQRSFNPVSGKFEIAWGVEPANAVKVKARRDNDDTSAPDGKLPMTFAGVLGDDAVQMDAEAIAYIESRDIAIVLDFSGSMAYDSLFRDDSIAKLGEGAIRDNLRSMFWEMGLTDEQLGTLDQADPGDSGSARDAEPKWLTLSSPPGGDPSDPTVDVTFQYDEALVEASENYERIKLEFTNGATQTFDVSESTGAYSGTGSNSGRNIATVWTIFPREDATVAYRFDDTNANVKAYFGLTDTPYPFPSGSWDSYVNYVRSDSEIQNGGHREMYGGITFIHYLLENQPSHVQTPALSRTSHYPFHAVRVGNELFVDFLGDLGFGDHVGLVSYDQARRQETYLNESGQSIDISSDPIEDHYATIKAIMQYKQANHYAPYTNIGGGIREARKMLADHGREGARPTILLMTDGNANTYDNAAGANSRDSGFSDDGFWDVPAGFDWSEFDDVATERQPFYVGSGSNDDRARRYALSQAYKAVEEGITVHTLAVGAGADRDLMKAIAALGGGEFISVDGDLSVENLISEVEAGFFRIAALVPPARLAQDGE